MKNVFQGRLDAVRDALDESGIEYVISHGRRDPMHRMHEDCIQEIIDSGRTPVIFMGSTNGADSPLYNPLRNPMTVEQQKEQLRLAFPDHYDKFVILTIDDRGNDDLWMKDMKEALLRAGVWGKSVVHLREKAADSKLLTGKEIRPLKQYESKFIENGFGVWTSHNLNHEDDFINASDLRLSDLQHLTEKEQKDLTVPDYLRRLVEQARHRNPHRDLLDDNNVPHTMLDLTLDRLQYEADINTSDVIDRAIDNSGEVTLATMVRATDEMIRESRTAEAHFSQSLPQHDVKLKIASASCNQTAGDWPRNVANACRAIDMAVADGADMLCLEELFLSAYERGDDFYYSDNNKTREMLQLIAGYAASKDPNLVISIGHPWYFSDKNIEDGLERRKNPIYNRINNNFNVQTLLTGGEIVSMSAKRYLFNYERGYEKRHFEEWSDAAANTYSNKYGKGREGTIMIDLPEVKYADGSSIPARVIPFGSPVVQIGRGQDKINVNHVICEEYWVGSRFDASADNRDYDRDNPLAQKARLFDISVAINPNASPPAANKIDKHYELAKLASKHAGVLVHTDGLGSSGSTFAQFGSRLMAQNGEIISEGHRLSMKDVAYTSQTVTVKSAVSKGHPPHAVVDHKFSEEHAAPQQDGPAPWENNGRREFEEEMRDEVLWLFDYMRKNRIQGFTEALSGGADSSYNSAKVRVMVDLGVRELGVEGFMNALSYLPYKQKVLDVYKADGEKAAVREIMDNMLTAVYMGTSNSSEETLRAARTLIEGGTDQDGKPFEGIGGKFHYRNVERLVEVYAEIYSGVNTSGLDDARDAEIRHELAAILKTRGDEITPDKLKEKIDYLKFMYEEVSHEVLSVAKEEHQISYENIQARLRQVLIMLFSNVENKLAIANPNLDEGRNSYATWGGDLHGGMISGNAHKDKDRQLEHMRLLESVGLDGIMPIEGLYWANKNRPSAELQPKSKDGKVTQYDEDQLGRTFEQMRVIAYYMLYDRPLSQNERKNNPTEVFQKTQAHSAFENDDIETLHDRIRLSYDKWAIAQFKVHGSPISMTWGQNIDHQSSMRTPNISANQRPEQAQLALYALAEMAKRDEVSFETLTGGHTLQELTARALVDDAFNNRLASKMWTPDAKDGRKMKIGTLYNCIKAEGFDTFAGETPMAKIIASAAQWQQKKYATLKH